jgi:AsmA protein
MKKVAIGIAVAVGVIIMILAILPFAVDLNKYKGTILTQVRTYINRPVDFDSISLTILTGLGAEIKGLRIADDPSFAKVDFIKLDRVKVKVALLPLLQKKIKVREVVLNEPVINVIRNSSGVLNFKNLLVPKPEEKPKAPKPGGLAALLVSNAKIRKGVFSFQDDKLKPGAKPFTISDIDLDAQDISFTKPVSFSLTAAVMSKKQNLKLKGTVGPMPEGGKLEQTLVDLSFSLEELPLAALPVKMPVQSGTMKIDFSAKGALNDKIVSKAQAAFKDIVIGGQQKAKAAGLSGSLSSDFTLNYNQERLLIQNGLFDLNKEKGTFSGSVVNLKTTPAWDIKLKSDHFTPAPILEQLPMFAGMIPGKLNLTGPASFSVATAGNKEAFQLNANTDMRGMGITFGKFFDKPANIPMNFSSSISMKKDMTQITAFDMVVGAITAKGSGLIQKVQDKSHFSIGIQTDPVQLQAAQNFIPMLQSFKPNGSITIKATIVGGASPFAMNIQASSDRLGLVLSDKPGGKMISGPMTADLSGISLNVDALKKEKAMSVNGTIKAARGSVINVSFKTLASAFTYGNDRFQVNSFNLAALKGSIQGSASYNLKNKNWTASPAFNGVEAANILDILNNFKGVFSGIISGNLKAQGIAGAPALDNLGAQANLTIKNGEWKNFDLAGTVLKSLTGIQGLPAVLGLSSSAQQYQSTKFESLSTGIDLRHKVINVGSMQLVNISSGSQSDIDAKLNGTISMDTNQLNLKGQVILPKKSSQRLGGKTEAFTAIMDDQKRIVLPLTITGNLKKPTPSVDTRTLKDAFIKYYSNKLLEKGLKKLPPGTEEGGKAVEDLLRGIFKKQ